MSDVREVTEYHEWMAGTVSGAGERLDDALRALFAEIRDTLPPLPPMPAPWCDFIAQLEARFSDSDRTEAPRPPSPSPQVTLEKRKRAAP